MDKEESKTSLVQDKCKVVCYCCGKNHFSDKCPDKDKAPHEEWMYNKGMKLLQEQHVEEKNDSNRSIHSNKVPLDNQRRVH